MHTLGRALPSLQVTAAGAGERRSRSPAHRTGCANGGPSFSGAIVRTVGGDPGVVTVSKHDESGGQWWNDWVSRDTGLKVGGEHYVPLVGVAIDVTARGTAATVTVAQRYVNREDATVEAVYTFPLEESAAVCGFEIEVGERRIVGQVEEAATAFKEFDEALSRGDGAYLLDQDRPNLFTASVGNLLPGEEVVVRISYVAPLDRNGDQVRLKIPTTVSPRYVPLETLRKMDPVERDHLGPPTVWGDVPYGLQLAVEFAGWSAVKTVECPSHPVRVETQGRTAHVELSGSDIQLDQDVVVTFTMAAESKTVALVAEDEQGDAVVMLDVRAPRDVPRVPVEVVFLVDCSGSMYDSSIESARNALLLCLRSLQDGDVFNVYRFGSTYERLFEKARPFTQESLDDATRNVQELDADLGGTELAEPLSDILKGERGTLPLRVLLLTDGEVGNENEIIEMAKRHAADATVFTIGIGYGASDLLVKGLARATGGRAEFVHPNERLEPLVMRQMARVAIGDAGACRVDWGALEPDLVAPAELPPLYPGAPLTMYGRVPKKQVRKLAKDAPVVELAVVGHGADGERRLMASLDLAAIEADLTIPRMLAREAIRDLEEGAADAERRGSVQTERRAKKANEAIIELAKRYRLMSSETSFVAVEERSEEGRAKAGPAELRRIPVALLKDWHGTDSGFDMRSSMMAAAPSPGGRAFGFAAAAPAARSRSFLPVSVQSDLAFGVPDDAVTEAPASASDPLTKLIVEQRADGSWAAGDALEQATGLETDYVRAAAAELGLSGDDGCAVVTTLAALWLLRTDYANRADEWGLPAAKAERWLEARGLTAPAGQASLDAWIGDVIARVRKG